MDDPLQPPAREVVARGDRLLLARFRADDVDAVHRNGELGYTLRADCWGRGYATEVAHLLLELGVGALGLERVAGSCSPANLASARVLEKIGMRREGVLRGLYVVRGQRQDRLMYALLRSDLGR